MSCMCLSSGESKFSVCRRFSMAAASRCHPCDLEKISLSRLLVKDTFSIEYVDLSATLTRLLQRKESENVGRIEGITIHRRRIEMKK